MIAVRREDNRKDVVGFWHTPDGGLRSWPARWDLASAREFVDKHRSKKSPLAVYMVRGWYEKKIWPQEEK